MFDVDLLMTPQVVTSGGRSTGGSFWGNADYTLNVDTDKAGLWPGGFLKLSADSGFGQNVLLQSGAIVPVNTAAIVPAPARSSTSWGRPAPECSSPTWGGNVTSPSICR